MTIRLLILMLVLLPLLGWNSINNTQSFGDTANNSVSPGQVKQYDFNVETDSGWLTVIQCATVSMHFDPDMDGTNTGATVHIRESTDSSSACADGDIVAVDRDGSGTITSGDELVWTGAVGARGFRLLTPSAPYMCVDVTAVAGTPDGSRVTIGCNP